MKFCVHAEEEEEETLQAEDSGGISACEDRPGEGRGKALRAGTQPDDPLLAQRDEASRKRRRVLGGRSTEALRANLREFWRARERRNEEEKDEAKKTIGGQGRRPEGRRASRLLLVLLLTDGQWCWGRGFTRRELVGIYQVDQEELTLQRFSSNIS